MSQKDLPQVTTSSKNIREDDFHSVDLVISELVNQLRVLTAQKDNLTGIQFTTLRMLTLAKKMTVSDLSYRQGVSLSAVTGLVNRLVASGTVERHYDEFDRRIVWIKPTEKGYQIIKKSEERRNKLIEKYLAGLEEARDAENFINICKKLSTSLGLKFND